MLMTLLELEGLQANGSEKLEGNGEMSLIEV